MEELKPTRIATRVPQIRRLRTSCPISLVPRAKPPAEAVSPVMDAPLRRFRIFRGQRLEFIEIGNPGLHLARIDRIQEFLDGDEARDARAQAQTGIFADQLLHR